MQSEPGRKKTFLNYNDQFVNAAERNSPFTGTIIQNTEIQNKDLVTVKAADTLSYHLALNH
jgi:hypothetical protein